MAHQGRVRRVIAHGPSITEGINMIATLTCGHVRGTLSDTRVGDMIICGMCTPLGTRKVVCLSTLVAPRYPARPNIDAILDAVMYMVQECLRINYTGKSFEMVEEEARRRLYDSLDSNMGGPPPAPKIDYEAEYLKLYKHLDAIRATLGIAPYPDGGLNPFEVYDSAGALVKRCRELQKFIKPPSGAHWGADWNSVVRMINGLVKP